MATFDSNVGLYEENVRKADSQRQLEGWQFLPFFRQKVRRPSDPCAEGDVDASLTCRKHSPSPSR